MMSKVLFISASKVKKSNLKRIDLAPEFCITSTMNIYRLDGDAASQSPSNLRLNSNEFPSDRCSRYYLQRTFLAIAKALSFEPSLRTHTKSSTEYSNYLSPLIKVSC